ncbi:uncharacterized protein [Palaemon carinicauda]|uniref:uncharacterized protein n=1 Tax=Palaemon carinicauda TaxID=392227 RepID=UPI0035B5B4BC
MLVKMKIVMLQSFLCVTYPLVMANSNGESPNENIPSSSKEFKASRLLRKRPYEANDRAASDPWISTKNMQLLTRGMADQFSTVDASTGRTDDQVPKAGDPLIRKGQQGQQQTIPDGRLLQTINSHPGTTEPSKGMYNQLATSSERLTGSWNPLAVPRERLTESRNQLPASSERLTESGNQPPMSSERLTDSRNQLPASLERFTESRNQHPASSERLTESRNQLPASSERLTESWNQLAVPGERFTENRNQLPASSERFTEIRNQLPASSERFTEIRNQLAASSEHLTESRNQFPVSSERLEGSWNQPPTTGNALKGTNYQTPMAIGNLPGNVKRTQGISLKKDKHRELGTQVLSSPDPSSLTRPLIHSLPSRIAQNAHGTLMKANQDPVPSTKVSGPLSSETSLPMRIEGPQGGSNFPLIKPIKQNSSHHIKVNRSHVSGVSDVYSETKIPAVMYNKDDYNGIPAKTPHETKTTYSGPNTRESIPTSGDALKSDPQRLQQLGVSRPSINRNSHTADHKHLMNLLQELRRPAIGSYPGSSSFKSQASAMGNSGILNQMNINRVGYPVELGNSRPAMNIDRVGHPVELGNSKPAGTPQPNYEPPKPAGMPQPNYKPPKVESTGNQIASNTPIHHLSHEVASSNNSVIFENYQNRQPMGSVLQLLPSHLGQHHPAGITSDKSTRQEATANPSVSEALGFPNTRQSQEAPKKPARGSAFGEDHGNILAHLSGEDGPKKNVFMEVLEHVFSKDEMETNPLVKQMHNRFESQLNTLGANALSNPSFGFLLYFILPFVVIAVLTFTLLGVAPEYLGLMGLLIPGVIVTTLLNDHGGRGRSDSDFDLSGKSNAVVDGIHRNLLASLDYYGGNYFSDVGS